MPTYLVNKREVRRLVKSGDDNNLHVSDDYLESLEASVRRLVLDSLSRLKEENKDRKKKVKTIERRHLGF